MSQQLMTGPRVVKHFSSVLLCIAALLAACLFAGWLWWFLGFAPYSQDVFLSHGAALFALLLLSASAVLLWSRARKGEISRGRAWLRYMGAAVLTVVVQLTAIVIQRQLPGRWRLSGETSMYTGLLFLGIVTLAVAAALVFGAILLLSVRSRCDRSR